MERTNERQREQDYGETQKCQETISFAVLAGIFPRGWTEIRYLRVPRTVNVDQMNEAILDCQYDYSANVSRNVRDRSNICCAGHWEAFSQWLILPAGKSSLKVEGGEVYAITLL